MEYMKGTTAAVFFGVLIIAVGVAGVFIGGTAQAGGERQAPVPTTLPTPIPTAVPAAMPVTTLYPPDPIVTTTAPVTVNTSIPVTTAVITTAPYPADTLVSADKARNHFLDIAYSANTKLERMYYTEGQNPLIIALVAPDKTDDTFLLATVRDFNEASQSVKLSEKITERTTRNPGDIVITFLPENGLSSVEGRPKFELTYNGKPAAKVLWGGIYINSNLKGDARNHTIARALYYNLGVTGDTADYPDSLFYSAENTNIRLNPVDKKAIAILYGTGLMPGMTLEDLRKVIYFP